MLLSWVRGGVVGVMEGSCVGYYTCYATERNSGFVGDMTGCCGDKARTCGYAAAYGGIFGDASVFCLAF